MSSTPVFVWLCLLSDNRAGHFTAQLDNFQKRESRVCLAGREGPVLGVWLKHAGSILPNQLRCTVPMIVRGSRGNLLGSRPFLRYGLGYVDQHYRSSRRK
jgi:hypothetical protein